MYYVRSLPATWLRRSAYLYAYAYVQKAKEEEEQGKEHGDSTEECRSFSNDKDLVYSSEELHTLLEQHS